MRTTLQILGAIVVVALSIFAHAAEPGSMLSNGPHDANVGEVRLHYVVAGTGPIVFVASPGWGIGSIYMQNGLAPLEKSFTLVFIDMRGSGGSTRPEDCTRMSQSIMADDIERLRALLAVDSISIVGHSDGGAIAIEYAERHPSHLRKLIAVDPGVLGDRAYSSTDAYIKLWADDPHYRDAARQALQPSGPHQTDQEFEAALEVELPLYFSDPDRYVPEFEKTFEGTHLSSYARYAENAAEDADARDQTKDFHNIRAKTLIINGTVDFVCPYEVAQRMHAAIPGSTLSLYANKGHVPWIEDPARFFREVSQFLSSSGS